MSLFFSTQVSSIPPSTFPLEMLYKPSLAACKLLFFLQVCEIIFWTELLVKTWKHCLPSFSLSCCNHICAMCMSLCILFMNVFPRRNHSPREYSFGKRGAQAEVSLSNLLFMPPHFWLFGMGLKVVPSECEGRCYIWRFHQRGCWGFMWDARRMFFAT